MLLTDPLGFGFMPRVPFVELANDGRVIYAATRSTGQIEEGRHACTWFAPWYSMGYNDGVHSVSVRVRTTSGLCGSDTSRILVNQRGEYREPQRQLVDYENAIGEWREKHILGAQLRPNEKGHGWPSRKERDGAGAVL